MEGSGRVACWVRGIAPKTVELHNANRTLRCLAGRSRRSVIVGASCLGTLFLSSAVSKYLSGTATSHSDRHWALFDQSRAAVIA